MPFVRFGVPRKVLPRDQSLHRQSAIALFRALLQGIQSLPNFPPLQSQQLQNVVRNRFKQNRHEQSARRIRFALVAGYQAVDLLDGARAGVTANETRILELLNSTSEQARAPPAVILPRNLRSELETHHKRLAKAYEPERPPKRSILDRPLPLNQLSGKRHVPRLFNAQGIPGLRISKPVSPAFSALLSKKIKRRIRRWETFRRLQTEMELAEREDAWDALMESNAGMAEVEDEDAPTWVGPVQDILRKNARDYARENESTAQRVATLQGIVDKEQALFEQERKKRRGMKGEKRQAESRIRMAEELLDHLAERDARATGAVDVLEVDPEDEQVRSEGEGPGL